MVVAVFLTSRAPKQPSESRDFFFGFGGAVAVVKVADGADVLVLVAAATEDVMEICCDGCTLARKLAAVLGMFGPGLVCASTPFALDFPFKGGGKAGALAGLRVMFSFPDVEVGRASKFCKFELVICVFLILFCMSVEEAAATNEFDVAARPLLAAFISAANFFSALLGLPLFLLPGTGKRTKEVY